MKVSITELKILIFIGIKGNKNLKSIGRFLSRKPLHTSPYLNRLRRNRMVVITTEPSKTGRPKSLYNLSAKGLKFLQEFRDLLSVALETE